MSTADLKPLVKPHYSWPSCLIADDARWDDFTRVARTVSVHVDHFNENHYHTARLLAQRHSAAVGVLIDAWGYGKDFDPSAPPTGMSRNTLFGARYMADKLAEAVTRLEGLDVACVQIVYERHHVKKDDLEWNLAIAARAGIVWHLCREAFPTARIEFYNYGHEHPSSVSGGQGWWKNQYLPELPWYDGPASCSLYEPASIELTREIFRKVCATRPDDYPVVPHLSLGWSHSRLANAGNYAWVEGWGPEDGDTYSPVISQCLGAEINNPWYSDPSRRHLYPDWSRADSVWLWPAAFEREAFADHWRAYCQGAGA